MGAFGISMSTPDKCQKITDLAKRRGFFWPSYDLYGGVGGFIDYGPLGSLMKRKIEQKWIDTFVKREGLLLIDSPIIGPQVVFDASGHTAHFTDPVSACKRCGRKWRADHLLEETVGLAVEGFDIQALAAAMKERGVVCPECKGEMDDPQPFNELFATRIGPYSEATGFCRPETAQGIFVNFRKLLEHAKGKVPFGVAQVGRCMRNEISPRQGPVRLREFTIMEFEFFFDPEAPGCEKLDTVKNDHIRVLPEALLKKQLHEPVEVTVEDALHGGYVKCEWSAYFMALAKRFITDLGVPAEKQYFREKLLGERAHYSAQTFDQMVQLERWGWVEVSGHAWRTDYDLKMHMVHSGTDLHAFTPHDTPRKVKKLRVKVQFDKVKQTFGDDAQLVTRLLQTTDPASLKQTLERQGRFLLKRNGSAYDVLVEHVKFEEVDEEETGCRFIPHVVEPSFGSDRIFYAVLENAYTEKKDRVILRIPHAVTPVEVAVFPLVSKDELISVATALRDRLIEDGFTVEYDASGSIGRRYARADEIGIAIALTVDYQSLEDNTVTARDRDTWTQVRMNTTTLAERLRGYLQGRLAFGELGVALPERNQ